jgi:hypothetical protein
MAERAGAKTAPREVLTDVVVNLGQAFMERRNFRALRAGDRVVIQTETAGQVEALVMGRERAEILVRLSRWSSPFTIPRERVLRALPGRVVA